MGTASVSGVYHILTKNHIFFLISVVQIENRGAERCRLPLLCTCLAIAVPKKIDIAELDH